MALNIKNHKVEELAQDVARLAGETKTEAIRKALEERKARLMGPSSARRRSLEDVLQFFEQSIWSKIPKDVLGKSISKEEQEEILGYGPHGV